MPYVFIMQLVIYVLKNGDILLKCKLNSINLHQFSSFSAFIHVRMYEGRWVRSGLEIKPEKMTVHNGVS